MRSKRAQKEMMWLVIGFILAIAVAVIMSIFLGKGRDVGEQALGFSPSQDVRCRAATSIDKGFGKFPTDVDNDGLKDSCDSCVCSPSAGECDNKESQDGLPDACAKTDKDGKIDRSKYGDACTKEAKTLYELESFGGRQCRPKK